MWLSLSLPVVSFWSLHLFWRLPSSSFLKTLTGFTHQCIASVAPGLPGAEPAGGESRRRHSWGRPSSGGQAGQSAAHSVKCPGDTKVAVHLDSEPEPIDFANPSKSDLATWIDSRLGYQNMEPADSPIPIKSDLATWIESRLGYQNMPSERKQSFLGQMNGLPKHLGGCAS